MGVGFDVESEGTHVVRVSFDVETGVSQSRKKAPRRMCRLGATLTSKVW